MRALAVTAVLLLMTTAVSWADSGFSFRVDLGGDSNETYYGCGNEPYWGDPDFWGRNYYAQPGMRVFFDDNQWSAGYQPGLGNVYYYPSSRNNRQNTYHSIIKPYQSIIKPYEPLVPTHPADRDGFHIYTPRPTYGAPELYGDYITDDQGYPIGTRSSPYTLGGVRFSPRHHRNRAPVVFQYSYGYQPYYQSRRIYTAPSCPEYGYQGGVVYQQQPLYDSHGMPYRPASDGVADEINIYEGDIYNIDYSGPDGAPSPVTRPPGPPVSAELYGEEQAADVEVPLEPQDRAYGARFYDRLRLDTDSGVFLFVIESGSLNYVEQDGTWYEISAACDSDFGAYGAYIPGEGLEVIYREGNSLFAAYPLNDGEWWTERLPYDVDFSEDITVGLVGGQPWVVFNSREGSRYVLCFAGHLWLEVGSGSYAPATVD